MVGADPGGGGAGAGAEVEGVDGQAAAVQAHHVGAAWRPVLNVAQVGAVLQHCVTPAGHTREDTVRHNRLYTIRVVIIVIL